MSNWTLHGGNCVDVIERERITADLIVTSPPYGSVRTYSGAEFDADAVMRAVASALTPGGVLCWNVATTTEGGFRTTEPFRQVCFFESLGLSLHDEIIWRKSGQGAIVATRHYHVHEYIWVLSKGKPRAANPLRDRPNVTAGKAENIRCATGRDRDDTRRKNIRRTLTIGEFGKRQSIWKIPHGYGSADPLALEHPASFPDRLARDLIATYSLSGDTVLDPMCGSGTTLRAAVDLGRQAIGIELHDGYHELIRQRMAQQALGLG